MQQLPFSLTFLLLTVPILTSACASRPHPQYKRLPRIFDEDLQQEIPQPNKRLTAERLARLCDLGFCWSAKHVRKVTAGTTTATGEGLAAGSINKAAMTPGLLVVAANNHHHHHPTLASAGVVGTNPLPSTTAPIVMPPYTITAHTATADSNDHYVGMYHHHALPDPVAATADSVDPNGAVPPRLRADPTPLNITTEVNTTTTDVGGVQAPQQDDLWDDYYHRLVQFKAWHGHCLVPRKYETDPKLSTWVEQQRAAWSRDYNKTPLSSTGLTTSETAHEAAGATFVNYPTAPTLAGDGSTSTNTTPLQHAALNPEHDDEDAIWNVTIDPTLHTIQHHYLQNHPSDALMPQQPPIPPVLPYKKLSLARKQKLDALGFVWSLRSKRIEDHWDEMFRQLVEYKNQHGDCLVPSRYEANLKLGKVRATFVDRTCGFVWRLAVASHCLMILSTKRAED
jgi:Helicase associated domain